MEIIVFFTLPEQVGKLYLTTSGGKSQDYCENGKSLCLVHTFIVFLYFLSYHWNNIYLSIFVTLDCLELEDQHRSWVHAALAFAREIEDFDDLVNPRHLFDCCLGPKPLKYVMEKIRREKKSKIVYFLTLIIPLSSLASSLLCLIAYLTFGLTEMLIRYSKEKYACIRGLKNEPLSNLAADSKKRKLSEEKGKAVALPSVQVALSSPTPSLEVTTFTPPTTRSKGKGKAGRSVWDDLATTMGHAHNVITDDTLKGLSSIPSHELVGRHIHKLVQVRPFFFFSILLYLFVDVYARNLLFLFYPTRSSRSPCV